MMKFIYAPAKHRRSGSTMQKQKAYRSAQARFDAARKVLPGFPWKEKFKTRAQIDEYLSHDKITCLICGKCFVMLAPHIKRIHGIDASDYKYRFGIMQKQGLSTNVFKDKKRYLNPSKHPENGGYHGRTRRNNVPAIKKECCDRLKSFQRRRTYLDFIWHFGILSTVWRYHKIPPPKEQASWSTFKKRWLKDKSLRADMLAARARIYGLK